MFAAFADEMGLDEETAYRLMEGFGGGFGGKQEVCGAFSAAAAVISYFCSSGSLDSKSKGNTYRVIRKAAEVPVCIRTRWIFKAVSQLDFTIRTKDDLKEAVQTLGFLPYFANEIPGFSIEEHTSPKAWFSEEPGVWEWKGPVIRENGCAYGKFFGKKAAFISAQWFPDFANFRRDGYDFDALYDDRLANYRDKELYELLEKESPILTGELKRKGNYRKDSKKGFVWLGHCGIFHAGEIFGKGFPRCRISKVAN